MKMLGRLLLLAAAGWCAGMAEPSTSPNSAVVPSVSFLDLPYGWNHSSLEKDIAAVFNKVAYGSTTPAPAPPSSTERRRPSTPHPPATTGSTTLRPPPQRPAAPSTEAPVTRGRFKPPLPPEYLNPFADKPILRGSQSEGGAGEQRRHKRPPPSLPRAPPEQERIPIRPPDLPLPNKQKPLMNTPTRGAGKDSAAPRHSDPHLLQNETEFNFVPILQNPAVTRILSGSNGRKESDHLDRRVNTTRLLLDMNKMFPMEYTTTSTSTTTTQTPPTEDPERESELDFSELPEVNNELEPVAEQEAVEQQLADDERLTDARDDYDLRVWGVAWDVHVYLMGGLFCLLAVACVINWMRRPGRVLSPLYFHACNGLLLVVGVLRAVFLLFDAYNLHNSYPAVMTPVLLNFAFPLLTLAFGLLFLFLVKFTRTQLLPEKSGRLTVAAVSAAAILHVAACLGLQVLAGCLQQPQTKFLLLANQWLVLAWAVALALAYLAAFPLLSRALNTLNPMFSTTQHVPPASLGLVLRSLLAVAMLLLLLVCVHLYGLFGVSGLYGDEPPRPWPWWGFQFSVRVIEVSVCLLMAFVASLRVEPSAAKKSSASVFALAKQRPMPAAPTADAKEAPVDLYPAICGANYAVQKKLYEDPYQLRTLEQPKALRFPQARRLPVEPADASGERPSSMLFAEEGFVRFRTSADPEQPMEEVLHQSMTRQGGLPVAAPRPPMPQPRWAPPPNHCHHPSDSDFASTDESTPSSSSSGSSHHHHHHHHRRLPADDVTPDSAVGSDIYSKNGDCPVEKYWCEELLSRSIIDRLTALHHHAGYAPLAGAGGALPPTTRLPVDRYFVNNLEAIYARPDDESVV